jgi:hypothetical protein
MDLEQQSGIGAGAKALVDLLTSLGDLMAERDRLAGEVKLIEQRIDALESAAADSIRGSGLENVRAAGRTWWVQANPHLSVPATNRKAVLEAAAAMGWRDEVEAVAASTLKSLLADRLKELDAADKVPTETGFPSLVAGTPFAGIVSEFIEPALRSRRVV